MNLPIAEMPLPIRFRPPAPMTDDELLVFSARNEILWIEREANGDIHIKPIPGHRVGAISLSVAIQFAPWVDQDGHGHTFSNAGFSLRDGSMRGAYIAWMHGDRWEPLSEREKAGFAPACPNFVVEIVGPYDELGDLRAKMEQWVANGAEVAWLIDPKDESVTVYRPERQPEYIAAPKSVAGHGPIAGFELEMGPIWDDLRELRGGRVE